jgi:hypothetical protein
MNCRYHADAVVSDYRHARWHREDVWCMGRDPRREGDFVALANYLTSGVRSKKVKLLQRVAE